MPRIAKIATAVVQANFHWTYVRVYSDAHGGLHGTGECFFAPGLTARVDELAQILIGEEANDVERLVEKIRWAASGAGSLGGVLWNAITGTEAALWDLKGKSIGAPVWQLLGGKFRDEVRLYLDCHAGGAGTPDAAATTGQTERGAGRGGTGWPRSGGRSGGRRCRRA